MRRILVLLLAALLIGCVTTPSNNVTVVDDTTLSQPGLTPNGHINYNNVTVRVLFDEPVIITNFQINNATQEITRVDEKSYTITKTFADGNYSVEVSAEDPAGNIVSYSSEFIVDTVVPTLTLDPENNEQVAFSDITITLDFSEEVELTLAKLDATTLAFTTTDKKTFTVDKNLNDGSYELKIKAKDPAGNTVESNTEFTVNIASTDNTAPPQITGVNATNTGDGGEIKLTWDATTVNDFKEYRIYRSSSAITNAAGLSPTYTITVKSTTTKYATGLTNGAKYCFAVTAVDNSGNENTEVVDDCASPSEVDTTAPTISDFSPTGTVSDNTPTIQVETSEASTCKYAVKTNDSLYYEYSNLTYTMTKDTNKTTHTKTNPALSNGTYNVYALCKDEAGNTMSSIEQWTFTVAHAAPADTTAPVISSVSATTGLTYTLVSWTTNESSNSSVISVDGHFTENSSSSMVILHSINITGLTQGTPYDYKVKSCDASGNCNTSSQATFTTTAPDTKAPVISGGSPSGLTSNNATILTVTTDETAHCKFSTTNQGYSAMPDNFTNTDNTTHTNTSTELADANYLYYVRCKDTTGNENSTSYLINFTIDTTPPIQVQNLVNETVTNSSVTLNWSALGDADHFVIYRNSTTPLNTSQTNSYIDTGVAATTFYLYEVAAVDAAGNEGQKSAQLQVITPA